VACLFLFVAVSVAKADKLDDFIVAAMEKHHVPGLSLAVIQDGEIVRARGYGFADQESKIPVTTATLFQAGSISKSVAAVGALHLVEEGHLTLDSDVNTHLMAWKVPENDFTKQQKVTLRRILSHSAGLTVHGFPGYAQGKPLPTLVQVLDGTKPANTGAIRVDTVPGQKFRYSGGGYTVMQQIVIQVAQKPFPDYLQQIVLKPFGMTNSTYEQPLPEAFVSLAAKGYYSESKPVEGGWHIYPEMAAAGLWTTASDLARFAIGVQRSLAGKANPVISQMMTRQMLTVQSEHDGLGVFLDGEGNRLRFMHGGRDEGFDAEMTAYAETGQGAVVMINANNNSGCVRRVIEAVAHEYHWPDR
jgi:CubicO group peptidase (beta-lactamase class C family)